MQILNQPMSLSTEALPVGASPIASATSSTETPPTATDAPSHEEEQEDDVGSMATEESNQANYRKNDRSAIGGSETKAVRSLKTLVFAVLVLFAVGVALVVYFYISRSENRAFEEQFHDHARQVLASLGSSLDRSLGAVDSLVVQIVSMARISNQTWPMVTIPDLEVRMGKVRQLANGVVIILYPLVSDDQRADWEAYSAAHGRQWVEESLDIQERTPNHYKEPIVRDYPIWNVIHRNDEYEKKNGGEFGTTAPGPYLPQWQHSPVIPSYHPYNWDYMGGIYSRPLVEAVMETHQVGLTAAFLIAEPDDHELIAENQVTADWYSDFISPNEEPMEPMSDLLYPIVDDATAYFDLHADVDSYNPSDHNVMGLLSVSFYWRDLIKDILPEGSNVVIVFENPCSPTFAYAVNGPTVEFLGSGDFPNSQFSDLEDASSLLDLREFSIKDSTYSGMPVNRDFCPMHVRVYPSEAMQGKHVTNDGIIFAICAALIFVFTSLVFVLYDFWVERRQHIVLTTAEHSNAIVSSLFPENVRDRAFPVQSRGVGTTKGVAERESIVGQTDDSMPVADLFENCTVLFADIAGFTSWSSERQPTEVFILLEAIFAAFDDMAIRRGVFKIETIGDCYVAVTGLPTPQKHHAVIMTKFAADCRERMSQVVQDLSDTLGSGTRDLSLRIGLHSGAVTAGVLRSQKARFQLFGDTVNTASRMESTGTEGKIHCSEATSEVLQAFGKSSWLQPRENKIVVKGKGEMQTYFVFPTHAEESTLRSNSTNENDSRWVMNLP